MDYVIILATFVAVFLCSWLAYRLLRRRKEVLVSCFMISGFWLVADLLLLGSLSWALFSDFAIGKYPMTVYTLQCIFLTSFACACLFSCYGLNYNTHKQAEEKFSHE